MLSPQLVRLRLESGFSQPISLRREERLNSARSLGVRSLSAPSVHAPEIKRTLTFKGIYTIQMDGLNIEDELGWVNLEQPPDHAWVALTLEQPVDKLWTQCKAG